MGSPQHPLSGMSFSTKDVPVLYVNIASPTISFNDIRIYLGEVGPKEVAVVPPTTATRNEPAVEPRLCLVLSPEFAKALGQAVLQAVEKYEGIFGPLRVAPTQQVIDEKLPPAKPS